MTHIDAMGVQISEQEFLNAENGYTKQTVDIFMSNEDELEEQIDDLIKNADKEEDKERLKALKVLAKYYKSSQIRTTIDHYADGRYDLTIDLLGARKRF